MSVITGGIRISSVGQLEGTKTRKYSGVGVPVAGTTLDGTILVGELYEDTATGFVYEYTEPGAVPTFTRIDTA